MKDYFIRLFKYDRYANQIILETILMAGQPEKPVNLMAHLLAAQQIWLNRCKDLRPAGCPLWPDWQAGAFSDIMAHNSKEWIDYLKQLNTDDFEGLISYKNLKGETFENKLSDILTQVINHGTHHRAQAGQHLITAGIERLPPTDYIFFIRAMNYW